MFLQVLLRSEDGAALLLRGAFVVFRLAYLIVYEVVVVIVVVHCSIAHHCR